MVDPNESLDFAEDQADLKAQHDQLRGPCPTCGEPLICAKDIDGSAYTSDGVWYHIECGPGTLTERQTTAYYALVRLSVDELQAMITSANKLLADKIRRQRERSDK